MRFLSATLLTLACLAPAVAWAANPYEIFRLGMSEAETNAVAEAHGGDIFADGEREGEEPRSAGPFRIVFGDVPAGDQLASGRFTFERDRLAHIQFNYFVWRYGMPPTVCDAVFETAAADIGEVYGLPNRIQAKESDGTRFKGRFALWESGQASVSLFLADAPPLSPSGSCDMLSVDIFAGDQNEREALERKIIEEFGRGRQ